MAYDLPDTAGLPGGGPGGRFTISAHMLTGRNIVVAVSTYPDGYRMAVAHGVLSPDVVAMSDDDVFRGWLTGGVDGLAHGFTRVALPWVMAQRAWQARWFAEGLGGAVHLLEDKTEWVSASYGFTDAKAHHAVLKCRAPETLWRLQAAGFWFPDAAQVGWLSHGARPVAALSNPGQADDLALFDCFEGGWTAEAIALLRGRVGDEWEPLDAAMTEWERTVQTAAAMSAAHLPAGTPEGSATAGDTAPESVGPRPGSVASLCVILGLSPFEVGVMVGERTFSPDGLAALAALRGHTAVLAG